MPHFCDFMKDQVWAIRKVCADMFSLFASKCSRKTRELILTEHFIRLLDDTSRWVKISAYKSLGSFIATFSRESNDEETKEINKLDISCTFNSNMYEKEINENIELPIFTYAPSKILHDFKLHNLKESIIL